jgi:hypothetical protein
MFLTLALLAAASPSPSNLDFSAGNLNHWEGEGFVLSRGLVSSADQGGKGRKALLHRTFTVPQGAREIHFSAALVRRAGLAAEGRLDVLLEAANREYLPRRVRDGQRWLPAPDLLPADRGTLREYCWDVSRHNGRRVRIALIDSDDRPGCHVVVAGFEVVDADEINAREFTAAIRRLEGGHKLTRLRPYTSKHFLAMSSAGVLPTESRLESCEMVYRAFLRHFRKRGFEVRAPSEKLMVAIFNTQAGFEAYLGRSMSSAVTGLYHPASNRLVVYDYATNRVFAEGKKRLDEEAKRGTDLERERKSAVFGRYIRDRRDDTNLSTMMHEVAHQLSFNCGLLNRTGDVPVWLAEGLAVYCESTVGTIWQGIGEPNPHRARALIGPAKGRGSFLQLQALVESDDWIRKAQRVEQVVLGYSQSWALFRLLMQERPRKLKAYLEAIHDRRTKEHRLSDFVAAFGSLKRLERRCQRFMREIVDDETSGRLP